ncbi:hypothetical protein [Microvirga terricola]|uniref:DUF3168 domain-containing protein n=1 Tax=Microvirga terricola TaxID=2719797 RepID=A0ABX0VCQ0_9HYPH|nr:hypothetical protein [Microvirga terricola]NIX77458.1 hypothetical protein [Microvirga terricola]
MSIQDQIARLIGRAVECSVGEPWDFQSEAGQNRLTGVIIAAAAPDDNPSRVLCRVSKFTSSDHSVNYIQATTRSASSGDLIESLLAGERVPSNLAFRYSWNNPEAVTFLDTRQPITDGTWLIGSIRLADIDNRTDGLGEPEA